VERSRRGSKDGRRAEDDDFRLTPTIDKRVRKDGCELWKENKI